MSRPLRIAMLAPISWRVPPRHYGPWEQVTSVLTEGLVARGLDVTLFATGDSITDAKLSAVCPRSYSEDPTIDAKVWECLHIAAVFERAAEFDIIHNQFDFLPLSYSGLVETPVVTTIHGFSSERIVPVYERYNKCAHYVAISEANRHPRLRYTATIHHGIRFDDFTLAREPGSYLLFFGRISREKGAAEAIALAQRAGRPLVLAGIIQDQEYYNNEVAPHLCSDIRYIGSVGPAERSAVLGGASALIHLINFDEPFGLSVVEAMACGTPVIARPRGSMREIVEPGRTGALADSVEEAAAALEEVERLDREAIRRRAQERFGAGRMVDDYVALYQRTLDSGAASASSKSSRTSVAMPVA